MDDRRLTSWLEDTSFIPDSGLVGVFNAWPSLSLPGVAPDRIRAVQPDAAQYALLDAQDIKMARTVNYTYDAVILKLPREKDLALSYLRNAICRVEIGSPIIVDGQKTDGVESILKTCRKHFDVKDVVSKHHGKLFCFSTRNDDEMEHAQGWPWLWPEMADNGYHMAPGVFSADGPDPASELLVEHLPDLSGQVVDLGSGWGYLATRILEGGSPDALHLVEANWLAVDCAKKNVTSDVAQFHWADALTWSPDTPVDHVVTNPPFHIGRAADPALGQGFIRTAARILKRNGTLWLVANRQLPYESTLEETFRDVQLLKETAQFKLYRADRPRARRKG